MSYMILQPGSATNPSNFHRVVEHRAWMAHVNSRCIAPLPVLGEHASYADAETDRDARTLTEASKDHTMPEIKIKSLTPANSASLTMLNDAGMLPPDTKITNTTVTFPLAPADAVKGFEASMAKAADKWGRVGHPYASLHAVLRKLRTAAGDAS